MKRILVSSYVDNIDTLRPKLQWPIVQVRRYCQEAFLDFDIVPVYVPLVWLQESHLDTLFSWIDGLCLLWWNDIDPHVYGQTTTKEWLSISTMRDSVEMMLIKYCIEKKIPVLGICRWMQMINVSFGWSLYQDISEHDTSSHYLADNMTHTISVIWGKLYDIFGATTIEVNSYHRQGIDTLWENLIVTAKTEEGLIEGIEHKHLPIMGVQWHPEIDYHTNENSKKFLHYLKLFFTM